MNINIWSERYDENDIASNYIAIQKLIELWKIKYPNVTFTKKTFKQGIDRDNVSKSEKKYIHNGWNTTFHFIIENADNKKYFVLTYWDVTRQVRYEFEGYDYENLVEIFTAQGSHDPNNNLTPDTTIKYTPINKVLWLQESELEIERLMSDYSTNLQQRKIPDKLFFSVGQPYGVREYLVTDNRFNCNVGHRIPEKTHIQVLNDNWINMDIYSVSGVSMRLIEGFGLQTAVLSTSFPQKLHSPIIPDYHYVKLDYDESHICMMPGQCNNSLSKKLADCYIDTFNELKKDKDRIDFIAKNAREYYVNNCTINKHIDNLLEVIDLTKILN
jgi:hypothetical protein